MKIGASDGARRALLTATRQSVARLRRGSRGSSRARLARQVVGAAWLKPNPKCAARILGAHNMQTVRKDHMFQLVYVSVEATAFSASQLAELLETSRRNNQALGVTGMLLHQEGHFLQALEGEEAVVRQLAAKIARDPRHSGFVALHEATSDKRDFPDWSMGFHDLTAEHLELEGYSRFLQSGISATDFAADPPSAKQLLLAFKSRKLAALHARNAA